MDIGLYAGIAAVLFALPWVDVARVGGLDRAAAHPGVDDSVGDQDVAIDSYSVGLVRREEKGAPMACALRLIG